MIVAGGTYLEYCDFPYDQELWGPGLRAAAAIEEITNGVNDLYTCVGPNEKKQIEIKSNVYDFRENINDLHNTISFHYLHNHSNPTLRPSGAKTFDMTIGPIEGDAVLRFGFIEGSAIVNGNRVVYDPQSPEEEPFHGNGSTAENLAIVLNEHEAAAYTGEKVHRKMLDQLTSGKDRADVAVIKCGASGVILQDDKEIHRVPSYETDTVWGIGSGDVFSAVFSAYWAEQGMSAIEAAKRASLATAYYCSRQVLPVPRNPKSDTGFQPIKRDPTIDEDGPMVYLASPFFSISELWLVEELRRILLKEGANVISPYHDIGHSEEFDTTKEMAEEDLTAIDRSDVVLALTDNCDPGTSLEVGYARKSEKPVVIYQNQSNETRDAMFQGSGCEIYNDLSTAVYKTLWKT